MALINICSVQIVSLFLILLAQKNEFYEIKYAVSNSEDMRGTFEPQHRIRKRASGWDFPRKQNTEKRGFSFYEKVNITRKHNELRKLSDAANMKRMMWDEELEEMAQTWADNCDFEHSPVSHRTSPTIPFAVESSFVSTVSYNEEWVIQDWYDEVDYFNYNTLECTPGQPCGHYTQVVWGDTYKVGCGIRYCDFAKTVNLTNAYLVICSYDPCGNYPGRKPYKLGKRCSECNGDHTVCTDNLCTNPTCFNKQCHNGGSLIKDVCMCECKDEFTGSTCSAERFHSKRTIHLLVAFLVATAVMISR